MKKEDITQNIIVKLNMQILNDIIRAEDKDKKLLGWQGIDGNFSYINDEIILHRFAYLKNTYAALELLGKILDNIDECLNYTYYFEYKGQKYRCEGYICDDKIIIDILNPLSGTRDILDEEFELIDDVIKENEREILIEYYKMIKYYKEYYTRLFDRGRTRNENH